MKTEFTIATWNIAGGRPVQSEELFDYAKEDIGYFANQLQDINPDIICLQESHLNETRSVAKEIAQFLGCAYVAEAGMSPSHVDSSYQLSNALISKQKWNHVEDYLYPYPEFPLVLPDGRPAVIYNKGFQVLHFDEISVMNTQMMPLRFLGTPYDSENGVSFAKKMEEDILAFAMPPSCILCGDFNYDKATELYSCMLRGMKSALPEGPTRPGGKKTDYIFVPESCKVIANGIVPTNTDHYLCWAKLSI